MELSVFISSALLDVARGINSANTELMNERKKVRGKDPVFFILGPIIGNKGHTHIEFDVAVTTKATKGGKAKGGLALKVLEVGGEATTESATENISRLKFAVQVATNLA